MTPGRPHYLAAGVFTLAAVLPPLQAQDVLPTTEHSFDAFGEPVDPDEEVEELLDLDLSELMDIEVTVVSRRSETLQSAPAAVYVLTGEEIRRAGHTSVQEALRMVPGTFVSHWENSEWDVTIRGFGPGVADSNFAYLNQVLVMIDGVVVYTPVFAGMWWGLQDLDMEHIERIEVIRGPSGILWGANAFHGLINIVTKDSAKTQGYRASVRVSNNDNFVTLRSSGRLNESTTYSAFARRTRYDGLQYRGGPAINDPADASDWGVQSGGVQLDSLSESGNRWRFWGRGYESNVSKYFEFAPGLFGSALDEKQGGQVAFSFDDAARGISYRAAYVKDRQSLRFGGHELDTDHLQLEVKREAALTENQRVTVGFGYDIARSDVSFYGGAYADTLRQNNWRVFISDTWLHAPTGVTLSAGVQAIDHEFSGFDIQPSIRAGWTSNKLGTFWASASRAIRTPSVEEELFGRGTLDNEVVIAVEAGWRRKFLDKLSLDLALYSDDYDRVRTRTFDPVTGFDSYTTNSSGDASGAELGADVTVTDRWTIRSTYAYHNSSHEQVGGNVPDVETVDEQYPRHIASLRSYYDLAENWELDLSGYLVDRFSGSLNPEYWRGDARVGWTPNDSIRVSVGVQGFNDPVRREFGRDEVRRLFYFSLDLTR